MTNFDDNTLMPFGKYQKYKLVNVPPDYLLFILDQEWFKDGPLKDYIKRNKSILEQEIKLNKKMNNR